MPEDENLIKRAVNRMARYLIAGFFFMVAGALVYATQADPIERCESEHSLEFESSIYS